MMEKFPLHYQRTVNVSARVDDVFNHLDDPKQLGSHMEQSSWMMAGSKMHYEFDDRAGKELGSQIILKGKMLGIPLFVREVISDRVVPQKKFWKTVGPQKMVIIDQYELGFELKPQGNDSEVTFSIHYSLPTAFLQHLSGKLLGGFYAKWCVETMAQDLNAHFNKLKQRRVSP